MNKVKGTGSMKDKKSLYVFTQYGTTGASSQYRILIYLDKLSEDRQVRYSSFWRESYTSKYIRDKEKWIIPIGIQWLLGTLYRLMQVYFVAARYDVVFIQKTLFPGLRINPVPFLKRRGIRVIMDVDDAIYFSKNDNSDDLAKDVDLIIVGNDTLAEHYRQFNLHVKVLPTVEYTPMFEPLRKNTFESKVIGWIGQKASIANLDLIVDPLNKVIEKHPEVEFVYICDQDYGYTNKIKNSRFIKWSKESFAKDMAEFTIGVMPLYDTPSNRGKCGFKLIQYFNLLKPVIASDVGVNRVIVDNAGYIAKDVSEWVEYLEKLLFSREDYQMARKRTRELLIDCYSFENVLNTLRKAIEG